MQHSQLPTPATRLASSSLGKRPAASALSHPSDPEARRTVSQLTAPVTTRETRESQLKLMLEEQRLEIERLKGERRGKDGGNEWGDEKDSISEDVATLREGNMGLLNDLEALRSQYKIMSGRHVYAIQSSEKEMKLLHSRVHELEKERDAMKSWERRANGLSIELEEERRKRAEKLEPVEDVKSGRVDDALSKEVKRQSLNLSTIHRENENLKSELSDMRLRSKNLEKASRDNEKSLKEKVKMLQEQLDYARQDVDSLTQTFPSTSDPEELSTLRNRLSSLSARHSGVTDDLARKESMIRDLQARLSEMAESSRGALSEMTERAQEAERELRWAREGRSSAERREELAKQELAILGQRHDEASSSVADEGRVQGLENLLRTFKTAVEEMSRDSREMEERMAQGLGLVKSEELVMAHKKISELEQHIQNLTQTFTELESANAHLDAELNSIMQRVASGEFNPALERCLEHRNNPASRVAMVRRQELEELKSENEELLERLAELDELLKEAHGGGAEQAGAGGALGEAVVPRSSFDRLKKEKEELERAHAKRLLRLKEIFTAKSKEFLESVYSLLGWRIKFDESGSDIRLTSMYAPKGKSGLTIKFTSSEGHFGTMQMSGMMSRGLEESRQFWVVERQSVPGFLAQVTTEMFEKTTIGRAAGYVGFG